jgi:hypothetical protein
MSAVIVASAVVGAFSADRANKGAREAAQSSSSANDAAMVQNQAQFEASQRLQASLAAQANETQMRIAGMSIAEQQRQFAAVQRVLAPFVGAGRQALTDLRPYEQAGQEALQGQRNLIGLGGADAQQAAINALAGGVEMQSLTQQGENAILQNASATGGLRGGNTQSALAQFRPAALSALINTQYERLGGLTSLGAATTGSIAQLGQASAAQQASASTALGQGINSAFGNAASNIAQLSSQNASALAGINSQFGQNQQALTQNAGAINAGQALASAQNNINFANQLGGTISTVAMLNSMRAPSSAGAGMNYGLSGSSGLGLSGNGSGLGMQSTGGTGLRF